MYRYGDSTPFPFEDNFIDTICAATDACVALFRAEVVAEKARLKAQGARRHAEDELQRLQVLERAVEAAMSPLLPSGKPDTIAEASALRIAQTARQTVKQARTQIHRRRDTAVRLTADNDTGRRVTEALSAFLLTHQLPKTRWEIHWNVKMPSEDVRVTARALLPCRIRASFAVQVDESSRWSAPVRVSSLEPELILELQRPGGWLRKRPTLHKQALHKLFITEVHCTPTRDTLVLRHHYKKPSGGYRVVLRDTEQALPTITPIDADGTDSGKRLSLGGDSGVSLAQLWAQIERSMHGLRRRRCEMIDATFDEVNVENHDEPAEIAEAILSAIAPTVREMRLRSKVPGELTLKRDLGDGRREELFVPRRKIEAKFADLPRKHRGYFEAIGLSGEATVEFVSREFPLSPPEGMRAAVLKATSSPGPKTVAPPPLPAVFPPPHAPSPGLRPLPTARAETHEEKTLASA